MSISEMIRSDDYVEWQEATGIPRRERQRLDEAFSRVLWDEQLAGAFDIAVACGDDFYKRGSEPEGNKWRTGWHGYRYNVAGSPPVVGSHVSLALSG